MGVMKRTSLERKKREGKMGGGCGMTAERKKKVGGEHANRKGERRKRNGMKSHSLYALIRGGRGARTAKMSSHHNGCRREFAE